MLQQFFIGILLFLTSFESSTIAKSCEESAKFVVYQNSIDSYFDWPMNSSLESHGCDNQSNFTIILHGWQDDGQWMIPLIESFLKYRGGCVVYMNYEDCVDDGNYLKSLKLWRPVSAVLTEKLRRMETDGVSPRNIFMYGFSLGAWIAIDAAINFGKHKIGMIDVCDMANIGFDGVYKKDPKDAAQNVQCIFTSNYAGSSMRDQCHQNWLMGDCGNSQPAANDANYLLCSLLPCKRSIGSHPLCNFFYISSFEHDFVANNARGCRNVKLPENMPENFKMGYMEDRRSSQIRGVLAAPTTKYFPYNYV